MIRYVFLCRKPSLVNTVCKLGHKCDIFLAEFGDPVRRGQPSLTRRGTQVAKGFVCKTNIRGCNSRPRLKMEKKEFRENLTRVAGAVIFNSERTAVLIGQRAQNTNYPGKYEFPGGKIEEGETPEEAITREILEELGLEVEPGEILHTAFEDLENLGRPTHQIFYIECRVRNGFGELRIDSNSHQTVEWIEVGKLTNLDLFEADKEFAQELAIKMERRESVENLIRVVTAVIIDNKGEKVLIAQRSKTASHPGKWTFVGGKVEAGESPEQALRREVDEETGLKVRVGRLLGFAEVDYRDYGRPSHQILYYEARILNGVAKLLPEIHQDVKWVKAEDLPKLDWIEGDLEFAKKLAVTLTSPIASGN